MGLNHRPTVYETVEREEMEVIQSKLLVTMLFIQKLNHWRTMQGIGKKTSTINYHAEIAEIILNNWPDPNQAIDTITEGQIVCFSSAVAHYSAPRFNAVVSAMKYCVPAAKILKRKKIKLKQRVNLSQRQFDCLIRELDTRPHSNAGLIVRFLAQTGLRINEARQLRWKNVFRDHIHVPACVTKSDRPREIPFIPGLAQTLEGLRRVGRGELILPAKAVKRSLKTACANVGLPPLSHHDFRHLFATRCIESAVDIPTAARWLGHQDGGALLGRVYFHLGTAHSRDMASRVKV